ncbi:MAG: cyclic nucleotide-binding domain-containing protein [Sulfurovum sp.]|nr:cyclic nucleotide-binding domain-containing protein [Sulfurovum sp.]
MNKPDVKKVKQLLSEAPLGKYLGEYGIDVLSTCASIELHLGDNEILFHQDDTDNAFYIVKRGRLARFVKNDQSKREKILHIFERGDLMGELSFIDGAPHSSSAKSLGESIIICFKEKDIKPLITSEPEVMYSFTKAIITRVHHTLSDIIRQQMALTSYISGNQYR